MNEYFISVPIILLTRIPIYWSRSHELVLREDGLYLKEKLITTQESIVHKVCL